jgi:hypothetical protein
MERPDTAAAAQIDREIVKPVFFAFLDFANEPIRATTSGSNITLTGSGDPDIDDLEFIGLSSDLVEISPIKMSEGGTESVTATLSALIDLDIDMLNELGDAANYQGRVARLWRMIRNDNNVQQGALQHYYTGYMTNLDITSEPQKQVIDLNIEGFVAAHSHASNRSYLDQEKYDAGDLSAKAAIAIANGTSGDSITNNTGIGGRIGNALYRTVSYL